MDKVATPDVGGALHSTLDLLFGYGSDLFVFIAIVAAVALFAFYFGRDRLTPLVAGIYVTLAIYAKFPYMDLLQGNAYLETGLFVLIMVVALVAFSGLASFFSSDGVGFIKVVGLSVVVALFIMAIAINVLPVASFHTWSAPSLALFSESRFFWWLVVPVAGVFFLGK